MHTVYISLGSNLGDRYLNLQNAVSEISIHIGKILSVSPIYETEPIGFESTSLFLNACIQIATFKDSVQVLNLIQEIEKKAGRIKNHSPEYVSRIIDIDVIFYNQEIIETANLTIPHPRFYDRLFVLLPMNDLNTSFVDPKTRLTIKQLLDNCNDSSKLAKIKMSLNFNI